MSTGTAPQGKLVRDRIPEIILRDGLIPITVPATGEDYAQRLREKLREELQEYLESGDPVELADLIEVCFAAATLHGLDRDDLLEVARVKREERGGFEGGVVWLGNQSG